MFASKRSFYGLRFCLDFTYTSGAHGAARMRFSEEFVSSTSKETIIDAPAKVVLARS